MTLWKKTSPLPHPPLHAHIHSGPCRSGLKRSPLCPEPPALITSCKHVCVCVCGPRFHCLSRGSTGRNCQSGHPRHSLMWSPGSLRSVAMNNSGKLTFRRQRPSCPLEISQSAWRSPPPCQPRQTFFFLSYQMVAALLVVVVLAAIGHLPRLHVQRPLAGLLPGVLCRLWHGLLMQGVAVVLVLSLSLWVEQGKDGGLIQSVIGVTVVEQVVFKSVAPPLAIPRGCRRGSTSTSAHVTHSDASQTNYSLVHPT